MAHSTTSPGERPCARRATSGAVALSVTAQVVARAVHLVLNVVTTVMVVRHLGPAGYGSYVLVVGVATVVGLVSDLGLTRVAVREISREPGRETRVLGDVVIARLALAVAATGATMGALAALGARGDVLLAGLVISGLHFTEAVLSVVIVFHVRVDLQYEALVRVVIEVVETAVVVGLVTAHAGLVALMAAPVVAAAVGASLAVALAARRLGHRRPARRAVPGGRAGARVPGRIARLASEAWPSGVALVLAAAYLRLPGLVLAWRRGGTEAGIYGAAYQPVEYLLLASGVAMNVALPLLSGAHDVDASRFELLYRRGIEILLIATIAVAAVLVVAGPALLAAVLGAGFEPAAGPVRVLGVALIPMVVSSWHGVVLLAAGGQRVTAAYDLLALAVSVVSGAVVIPVAGAVGAAAVLLVTALTVAVAATAATRRRLGAGPPGARVATIAVTGAMVVAGAQALTAADVPAGAGLALALAAWALVLRWRGLWPSLSFLDAAGPAGEGPW